MLTATEFDILARLRDGLHSAARGAKAPLVEEAARMLRCSVQTVYRKLDEAGFDSGRKRRSDAGESVLDEDQLRLVAGVLLASVNNKGQRMPVITALEMLRAGGQITAEVSDSTVSRQLHARRMHPDQLTLPTPSVQLRSLHPNHVWQVDSTTGAYYYLPDGRLRWMPEDEFYKNKVHNLVKASTDLLTRYAATDHTSAAFKVRYYLGGETAANLLDFLTWAMWKQDSSPMHGVPAILMMDPGAANKSQVVRNFSARLGVQLIHHAPGAARVTGSVEKTHDLVRMHFETRLRFENPGEVSLDRLNDTILRWAAAFCTARAHSRHGRTRYGAWMTIMPEQLRVAASLEALRDAATREPEQRRVDNDKTIRYEGKLYDLALVPGVVAGLKVTVVLNPFRAPAVDVLFVDQDTGAESWHVVEPVIVDQWGYREGAPVIGQQMRTAAHSQVDRTRGELTREAYRTGDGLPTQEEAARARKAHAQAYAGVVDNMADVNAMQVPIYLPRNATPLPLPTRQVEARRLNVVEACIRLHLRLGGGYSTAVYARVEDWLKEAGQDGISEAETDALAAEFESAQQGAAGGQA